MRRAPACVVLLLIHATTSSGGAKFVESSRPARPADMAPVVWESGGPTSDLVLRDGVSFKTLESGGTSVVASVHDVGKRFRLDLYIANGGAERFEVYPELVSMVVTSPKEKALQQVSVEKMARSIKRKAAWAAALAGLNANATDTVTSTTTATGRSTYKGHGMASVSASHTGHATTVTQVPDHEARAQSRQAVRDIHEQASAQLAALDNVALEANTLMAGDEVMGSIFFAKNGEIRTAWITVPLGKQAFQFPLLMGKARN